MRELKLGPEAIVELGNPEAVKQAVIAGLGLAFLSTFAVGTELKVRSLVALKVHGLQVSRGLKIVYRKDKHLSRAVRAFIETAKNIALL